MEKIFRRPAQSKKLETNRLTFHYLDWPGSDPAIVLLHPNRTNARVWDFVVESSALKNRFIAWDARGHGLSDYPSNGYDLNEYVDDLEIFSKRLNLPKFILVGAATGGNISLLFSSKHKDLVKAIIVADPGLSLDISISQNVQREIVEKFSFDSFDIAKTSMPFSSLWSEEMLNHYANYCFSFLEDGRVEWKYFPFGAQYTEKQLEQDIWDKIDIECPTLILRGESSSVFPENKLEKLKNLISGSEAYSVSGCDHRISQDQPKRMSHLIDKFLTKTFKI